MERDLRENREALICGFKTLRAKTVFVHDATKVAVKLATRLLPGQYETIALFVNKDTGHIRLWCEEDEPVIPIIEMRRDTLFRKMLWRVKGPAYVNKFYKQ